MKAFTWAAIALLLVACSDASTPRESDGPFLAVKPESEEAWMTALYQGPLVVRHGCVLIGHPGEYTLPVWNVGTTTDSDDAGRLVVHDGSVAATDGEDFEMGGGYVAEFQPETKVDPRDDQIRWVEDWLGYTIPERCLGPDVYGIWSVGQT